MTYWISEIDGVSKEHVHEFDEYFTVVQGKYTVIINDERIDVCKGDEYFIPKNLPHAGEFVAGTRTIHCVLLKTMYLSTVVYVVSPVRLMNGFRQ